jgi:hypothetical protein
VSHKPRAIGKLCYLETYGKKYKEGNVSNNVFPISRV